MDRETGKILIVVFCCWLAGCIKDKPAQYTIPAGISGNAYVVCEGSFGSGNASLYSIDSVRDTSYGDLFAANNNGALGDVFQSMKKTGSQLFLCINNSDRIVVLDAATLKTTGTIHLSKPRYILPVSGTKAYVSSEYSNKVYIINTQTLQLADSILLPYKNTEGMCLVNGSAFVCTWDTSGNKIYAIDPLTDKITQTIQVDGYAPQEVLVDKEQMLWVLSGNKTLGKTAAWTRLDPSTGQILMTCSFPTDADPLKPVLNNTKDTLYFIEANYYGGTANNGVYRMGIHETTVPLQPFVAAGTNQYYYALGIDPVTDYIYIGDPKGFIQKGAVMIYRPDGVKVSSFSTGLGPGAFYFGN